MGGKGGMTTKMWDNIAEKGSLDVRQEERDIVG